MLKNRNLTIVKYILANKFVSGKCWEWMWVKAVRINPFWFETEYPLPQQLSELHKSMRMFEQDWQWAKPRLETV